MTRLALIIFLLLSGLESWAEDFVYRHYDVSLRVHTDNSVSVVERTNVFFTRERHGIIRDLPCESYVKRKLPDNKGGVVCRVMCYDTDYDCIEVNEPVEVSEHDDFVSLKIGHPDRMVVGDKSYVVKYRHSIGDDRTKAGDLFYYSILGPYHETTTDTLTFSVRFDKALPQASLDSLRMFYGAQGDDRVKNHCLTYVSDSLITGRVTGLKAREAVTIYLPLPEGYFCFCDNSWPWWAILLCITGVLIIMVLVWEARSQNNYTKVLQCWPPEGCSSADIGYIYDTVVDDHDIISLIPYFAHQGLLEIDVTSGHPVLRKKAEISADAPEYQKRLFRAFFAKGSTFDTQNPHDSFGRKWILVADGIKSANKGMEDDYSPYIIAWLIAGFFGISSFVAADITGSGYLPLYGITILFLLFMQGLCSLFLWERTSMSLKRKAFVVLFELFCVACQYLLLNKAIHDTDIYFTPVMENSFLVVHLIAVISAIFLYRMRKMSAERLEKIGYILGFKEFIEQSEKPMLDSLSSEHEAYFFDILPYAIAFGLSEKWIKKFEDLHFTMPSWYKTNDLSTAYFITMMSPRTLCSNHMRDAVTAERAKQMSARSESSASTGSFNGFSGGGFGGGGSHSW